MHRLDRPLATDPAEPDDPRPAAGRGLLIGTIFGVSGASALVYQTAWQRILALHSGVGIYSVAMIVAAFLAGLGLGSYWGGRKSAGTPPLAALRMFAMLEIGIGLFALASCYVYYDLLYLKAVWLFVNPWRAGVVHSLLLLFPTTLMGMSLPFLVRAAVREPAEATRTIGYLYGVNVVGAAVGALAAPWVLMRFWGVRGAVAAAAVGNLAAGLTALVLATRPPRGVALARPAARAGLAEPAGSRPFGLWLGLYTLSGFVALSLEIVWFRLVDVAVKSTAFTFGTVLAIYLAGLAAGSLAGRPIAERLPRPLKSFLICQCVLLLWAGLALAAVVGLPADLPLYRDLVRHWKDYEAFPLGQTREWGKTLALYLGLPGVLYGGPTVLMGFAFCILQRAVHDDARTSGLKVGLLQTGNIVGNVAGSLVAGLVLLNVVGTAGAIRLLLFGGLAFAALGVRYYGWRTGFPLLGGALLVLGLALPDGYALWLRLHGLTTEPALFAEDATAVTAITPDGAALRVSVDGKGHSWLPFGGVHSHLGALPAAIHAAPRRVAIIGLGSGDTAWASAFRAETEQVTVFEISAPQRELLAGVARAADLPQLRSFLADPRVSVRVADGRNAIASSKAKYDLIEADALRPTSAYSGNVYSLEFFRLCAEHLEPGGLMCSWVPTPRIYRTFCQVFPHVLDLAGGSILVGSREPIPGDRAVWGERLRSERARAYLGSPIAGEVLGALGTVQPAAPELYLRLSPNRDLFPRDEFLTPGGR